MHVFAAAGEKILMRLAGSWRIKSKAVGSCSRSSQLAVGNQIHPASRSLKKTGIVGDSGWTEDWELTTDQPVLTFHTGGFSAQPASNSKLLKQ